MNPGDMVQIYDMQSPCHGWFGEFYNWYGGYMEVDFGTKGRYLFRPSSVQPAEEPI